MRAARRLAALAGLALVVSTLTGCGGADSNASASEIAQRKVRVTTTTNFITDTVRQIGGERVEVTGLMGPGVDPTSTRRAHVTSRRSVTRRDRLRRAGARGQDGRPAERARAAPDHGPDHPGTSRASGCSSRPSGAPEQYDPHVWFDVELWKTAARTAATTLKQKDPRSARAYDDNLRTYLAELDETTRTSGSGSQRSPSVSACS
jgi:manganese/zinc/iron transport system substrate-binding protein